MAKTSMKLPRDFVALDLETTGLDAKCCEIIEVALVVVRDYKVAERFSTLVNPSHPIPGFITALTGISDDMVANSPIIDEVLPLLVPSLNGSVVVGHNICFDDRFLKNAMDNAGLSCSYTMVDTLRFSRHVLKKLDYRGLDSVAEACGVSVDAGDRHRALYDAELAALSAIAMWPLVRELYGDDPDSVLARSSGGGLPNPEDLKPTVDAIDESNPFYGSKVLFTGKLDGITREEAMQKAVNLGAVPLKGFSKKVDFLIVGSFDFVSNLEGNPSSKLKKAQKAIAEGSTMQIVSESFFVEFAAEV